MKKWDFSDNKNDILTSYREERDAGNYSNIVKKYRDPATKYAFQVLEGDVLSSRSIKLDSFRHLQDLRRVEEKDPEFPYVYDLDKAREIVQFASLCPNPDTGRPTPLDTWQLAILCKIVAWQHKDEDQGPRFSDVIISVARTNGKTYLATILIVYHFLMTINDLRNQDVLMASITTAQTDKAWRYIMSTFNMLEPLPGFKQLYRKRGIHVVSDKVSDNKQNRLLKMSEQSGVFDSYHFKFAVTDEAGSNEMPVGKINDNKGKITTGMTQTNGQIVQISTAYPDSGSYLYRDEKMMIRCMEKDSQRQLDDHLCMIWEQDSIDEVHDYKTWSKSNPLMNLSNEKRITMTQNLVSKRDSAMQAGTLADFENKSLNLWLQTKVNAYLSLGNINRAVAKRPPINIDGRDVFIGLDLSHFSDDTGVVFTIPYHDDRQNRDRFYIIPHSFVPTARAQNSISVKEAQDGINYRLAEKNGYATIAKNEYGYIDDDVVYNYILDFVEKHNLNVKFFLYDAWEASPLVQRFVELTDWNAMPVRQGTLSLNQPTTYFRRLMDMHDIKIADDVVLRTALKNAILLEDNHGIKVDKDKQTAKIDLVDAIIDTMYRAQYYFNGLDPDRKEDKKNPFSGWTEEQKHNYFSNYSF